MKLNKLSFFPRGALLWSLILSATLPATPRSKIYRKAFLGLACASTLGYSTYSVGTFDPSPSKLLESKLEESNIDPRQSPFSRIVVLGQNHWRPEITKLLVERDPEGEILKEKVFKSQLLILKEIRRQKALGPVVIFAESGLGVPYTNTKRIIKNLRSLSIDTKSLKEQLSKLKKPLTEETKEIATILETEIARREAIFQELLEIDSNKSSDTKDFVLFFMHFPNALPKENESWTPEQVRLFSIFGAAYSLLFTEELPDVYSVFDELQSAVAEEHMQKKNTESIWPHKRREARNAIYTKREVTALMRVLSFREKNILHGATGILVFGKDHDFSQYRKTAIIPVEIFKEE